MVRPARRSIIGPPSPFTGRSSWRRFREDTWPRITAGASVFWHGPYRNPTLIALVVTILVVIATKAYTGRGTPLRGGLPSGHAALAFAGWMAATYIVGADHRFLISSIALLMAFLVAQTRIEAGVHSAVEVAYGGILGALVTLALFQLF